MANDDQQTKRHNDDYDPRMYEDELDTSPDMTDPIITEENDDPTQTLGVPPKEFDEELDRLDTSGDTYEDEDMREYIEDQDEDMKLRQ